MNEECHEARTHLSRLVAEIEAGEEALIARSGKLIARLCTVRESWPSPGAWKGRVTIRHDVDEIDPAIEALFAAESATPS